MEKGKVNYPKDNKMTLTSYYNSLPRRSSPKNDFVKSVAAACDVSLATARLWVYGKSRPSRKEFYDKLSEITGIEKDKLF